MRLVLGFGVVAGLELIALPFEVYLYWHAALKGGLFVSVVGKGDLALMGIGLAVLAAVPLTIFMSLSHLTQPPYGIEKSEANKYSLYTTANAFVDVMSKLGTAFIERLPLKWKS